MWAELLQQVQHAAALLYDSPSLLALRMRTMWEVPILQTELQ